jgi:hypothetical protein
MTMMVLSGSAAPPMDLRSCELSGKGLADEATAAEVARPYGAHPNQHHSSHPQLRRQTWSDASDHGALVPAVEIATG